MNLEERIISTIKSNLQKDTDITINSRLVEDLMVDSFDKLMIISALEDEFSITIDESDFADIISINDIVQKLKENNDGV
ncbi:acyl carrier protein [Petroclostridium sp. X23]|uniref:acyl carrier protein n=1 Tax=Petroclostridium sp. X23 TaxID=3045146 RepID=UPI0024ACD7BA|nr:acyl carrier protein [Petroclostridium sp. X23]WHH59473.1 acyl carrier protein [Petroclostridium sp. X23]